MLTGDVIDTVMNLVTFAFLGAMGWLLARKLPARDDRPADSDTAKQPPSSGKT